VLIVGYLLPLQEAWSSRETELLDEVASLTDQLAQQSELAQQAQQQLQQQGAALEEAQQELEELRTQVNILLLLRCRSC
jgi:ABC-type transporter Mla subunit MlaD